MHEIERKFLVASDEWRVQVDSSTSIRQGYLTESTDVSVRVRIGGDLATLNVKGPPKGITRPEFEYGVPVEEAEAMLELCGDLRVDKTRHELHFESMLWEIDEFHGPNRGLTVAEIELDREDQAFARPSWLGQEVTRDPRYLNVNLARTPFGEWDDPD
ncbi:MAG TPA: CYTH domain-containing protein [Acidobacteriota bacterium]|nr:CYTH domain-containing protein [Acidobacteriota bacterium]